MQQHPIAVYGTLRPGEYSYKRLLNGKVESSETHRLYGFQMWTHGPFPFAVHTSPDDSIIADILTIKPEFYNTVIRDLDQLEGVNFRTNGYKREMFDGCWMYVWHGGVLNLEYIPSGDWKQYVNDRTTVNTTTK